MRDSSEIDQYKYDPPKIYGMTESANMVRQTAPTRAPAPINLSSMQTAVSTCQVKPGNEAK